MTRNIPGALLAAVFLASPALAQSSETWNGLPDRFQIDTGYYRMDAATILRLNGSGIGGSDIDFERDLGVGPEVAQSWTEEGFGPSDYTVWTAAGFDAGSAANWKASSFTAAEAGPWKAAGFGLDEAVEMRKKGLTPIDAKSPQ